MCVCCWLAAAQAPHCLQEDDLDAALDRARLSPLEDVRSNTELTSSHISTLKELGGLVHQGRDLYQEIKTVSVGGRGGLVHQGRDLYQEIKTVSVGGGGGLFRRGGGGGGGGMAAGPPGKGSVPRNQDHECGGRWAIEEGRGYREEVH